MAQSYQWSVVQMNQSLFGLEELNTLHVGKKKWLCRDFKQEMLMAGRYINNSYLKVQQKCFERYMLQTNLFSKHRKQLWTLQNTIYEAYDIREADESSNSFRPNSSSVHPNLT